MSVFQKHHLYQSVSAGPYQTAFATAPMKSRFPDGTQYEFFEGYVASGDNSTDRSFTRSLQMHRYSFKPDDPLINIPDGRNGGKEQENPLARCVRSLRSFSVTLDDP